MDPSEQRLDADRLLNGRHPRSSLFRQERRIEGDLPEVTVRIREIASVTAPKGLLPGLPPRRPRLHGLHHHRIDLLLAADVVSNRKLGGARWRLADTRVVCEVVAQKDRQLHTALQIEERRGAVLEFPADNAPGWQPEAVLIKRERSLYIVHAYREQCDSCFHSSLLDSRRAVPDLRHRDQR